MAIKGVHMWKLGELVTKHNGVDKLLLAFHAASFLHPADALEAEVVPDPAARNVRLIDEVEDTGLESEQRGPLEEVAAHDAAAALATVAEAHEEAGVAYMARPAYVVRLDVEASEELVGSARPNVEVLPESVLRRDGTLDHHGDKMREVVAEKLFHVHRFLLHVRRPLLDDGIEELKDGIDYVCRGLFVRVEGKQRHGCSVFQLVVQRLRDV